MAERPQIISTNLPTHKLSREDQRRQRDLEAARKAGTAAPATGDDGKAINPHIPEYISRAPWYADSGSGQPSLAHQRQPEKEAAARLDEWYDRGAKAGPAAKKFRKGACENCGAMSHKRQDCVERPRKRGAKFTNKDIMADEVIQSFSGTYDAKRDRWNGYDPSTYRTVVEEYEAVEAAQKAHRAEQMAKEDQEKAELAAKEGEVEAIKKKKVVDEFGSDDEDEVDEEDKYAEAAEQVGQKLDDKNRITVRNLRIREDTAKYLINLNPESAYYDPKTRAMRDAPEDTMDATEQKFAGDNFHRYSGEATNMQKLQNFAWQSNQRGHNVHIQANPTAGELLHREFTEKKEVMKDSNKVSILEKYGGEQHLERLPRELLSGQTENYVEYSRTGQVLKGREKAKAQSKYEEDVHPSNHTSVWGSYFDKISMSWGYACCHSFLSISYCVGEAGKASTSTTRSLDTATRPADANPSEPIEQSGARGVGARTRTLVEQHQDRLREMDRRDGRASSGGGSGSGSGTSRDKSDTRGRERSPESPTKQAKRLEDGQTPELDRDRLRRAMEREKKRKEMDDDEAWKATKKGKADVTQEEVEAYRLSKQAYDDPMANYKDEE